MQKQKMHYYKKMYSVDFFSIYLLFKDETSMARFIMWMILDFNKFLKFIKFCQKL